LKEAKSIFVHLKNLNEGERERFVYLFRRNIVYKFRLLSL